MYEQLQAILIPPLRLKSVTYIAYPHSLTVNDSTSETETFDGTSETETVMYSVHPESGLSIR